MGARMPNPRARVWITGLALVALVGLAHYPAVQGGFVWDDEFTVPFEIVTLGDLSM